jgi:hypothetical protein
MRDVREALVRDDLETARARLADAGRGTDDLLFALEDGLLLHYAGDPELSNSRFQFVEQRVDDLYTRSITRTAFSLVTSDLILKFEPRGIENFLINYYGALNYLELGEVGEAWVEWRKLNTKLQFSREQGNAPYLDPPFFDQLAGLGLEADDPNAAYVSMRLAEDTYREWGISPPTDVIDDLFRLGTELGMADHLDIYRSRYGDSEVGRPGNGHDGEVPGSGTGTSSAEIIVLVEDGLVAPIEEAQVYIPITEERATGYYEGGRPERLDLAFFLAQEYAEGRYAGVGRGDAKRREVAYVLPLAFPVFGVGEPAFHGLEMEVGGATVSGRVALEVSELQRQAFEDRLLGIYAKTIVRALVKSAAAAKLREEAEEEGGDTAGEIVGFLANAVNVATERADTRAWLGLPDRIWMARVTVRPGVHDVRLRLDGLGEIVIESISVGPGERRLVGYRVF